ncbi:MAG TPA: hypothetical protein VGK50_04020 [Coriobacteriia bacterium]
MNLRGYRIARATATAVVALAIAAGPLLGAAPAAYAAAPPSPAYFNRTDVVGRAARWTSRGVPYDQGGWVDDYRSDCSGFVSYAWGLDQSYVTWTLPDVSKQIGRDDMLPGDIILNTARHVIVFGGWANSARTAYVGYEEAGAPGRAVKRVIPFPYDSPTAPDYKPYRYTGGHNLYAPDEMLPAPLIQTYAGDSTIVPSWAGAKNAQRRQVASQRAAAAKSRETSARQAKADAERKDAEARAASERRAREAGAAKMAAAERREDLRQAAALARADAARQPLVVQFFRSFLAFIGV